MFLLFAACAAPHDPTPTIATISTVTDTTDDTAAPDDPAPQCPIGPEPWSAWYGGPGDWPSTTTTRVNAYWLSHDGSRDLFEADDAMLAGWACAMTCDQADAHVVDAHVVDDREQTIPMPAIATEARPLVPRFTIARDADQSELHCELETNAGPLLYTVALRHR